MTQPSRVSLGGHHAKTGCAKKVLGHRTPQIPDRLKRGVLFLFDKWLGIETQLFTQRAKEFSCAIQTDRSLKIRRLQGLTQLAPILAIEADVRVRVGQRHNILQRAAQWKSQIDLCTNALNQTLYFSEIRRRIKVAISRTNDIDQLLRIFSLFSLTLFSFSLTKLVP